MDLTAIRTQSRFYTDTNSTTFPDTDLDREANNVNRQLVAEIIAVQGSKNILGGEKYTSLVATDGLSAGDNGYNGEYSFDSDMMRIVRAEIMYEADTTPERAEIYDMSQNSSSEYDEDSIQGQFSEDSPFITLFRGAYRVRPLYTEGDDVTGGIHLWYEKRIDDLSEITDTPDFEELFHNLIPLKVAKLYSIKYPSKFSYKWLRSNAEEYKALYDSFRKYYRKQITLKKQAIPSRHNFK